MTIFLQLHNCVFHLKFGYFQKATKFLKNLQFTTWRNSVTSNFKWKIISNFVAFSEYLNFNDIIYLKEFRWLFRSEFCISTVAEFVGKSRWPQIIGFWVHNIRNQLFSSLIIDMGRSWVIIFSIYVRGGQLNNFQVSGQFCL